MLFSALDSLAPALRVAACLAWAASAPVASAGASQGPAEAGAVDPFAAGLRWSAEPPAAAPWVPCSVAFTGDGQFIWSAPAFAHPALALWPATAAPSAEPLAEDGGLGALVGTPLVRAGAGPRELFAATQALDPATGLRRTRLARYDATAPVFAPLWIDESAPLTSGSAPFALAAERVVRATFDAAQARVVVDWLDAETGALVSRVSAASSGPLRAFAASSSGGRAVVHAGSRVRSATPAGWEPWYAELALSTQALALSGDGRALCFGDAGRLRRFADEGSGFAELAGLAAQPGEVAVRAALSGDAETLALAWWAQASGDVRFEIRGGAEAALVQSSAHAGAPGGLQNFPAALTVSADGARAALGLWGIGDAAPEALLWERGQSAPLLALDLPGSVLDLALDAGGTRLAVAAKDAHANVFSARGAVHYADTGERDLQQLGAAQGALELAARREGASIVIFALGHAAELPAAWPGAAGLFWLDGAKGLRLFARKADANGRADLAWPLPGGPAGAGFTCAAQAAFRIGGATVLSGEHVLTTVLP